MSAERTALVALLVACAAAVAFIAGYAIGAGARFDGAMIALAAAALACAAVAWFRLLPAGVAVDEIHDYPSLPEDRAGETRELGADIAAVTRHRVLSRTLYAALSLFGLCLLFPLRSLGPAPGRRLFGTKWRGDTRIVRIDGTPVHVDDLNVDSTVTAFPEGATGDAQSQVALIRLPPGLAPQTRGYIAYSRVCTHAGCPVALYRASAKQLLCPCHQSVFDVTKDGAVVSGPADRSLPRLPITVGPDGILRATAGFAEPVGPGFWERA